VDWWTLLVLPAVLPLLLLLSPARLGSWQGICLQQLLQLPQP
jgi:hypothetical protein